LLYLLLHRTRIGKAIRAVADNREAAELNGIPTTQVLSFASDWARRSQPFRAR
jgi:branched-chain amino acid transport system permease protein